MGLQCTKLDQSQTESNSDSTSNPNIVLDPTSITEEESRSPIRLNTKPSVLNTKPSVLYSKPSILNSKPYPTEEKEAVLIGLNYPGTRESLSGCINDALRMEKTLNGHGYKTNVLTDNDLSKNNSILNILSKLVSSNNKKLYFQYSGHGLQTYDYNGDEIDHYDEALYGFGGNIILDDDIHAQVTRISQNTQMVMVIDACHSGSMVDLPYQLINNNITKINKNRLEGNIICISGCKDTQTSADVTQGNISYGAMSNALQKALKTITPTTTWRELVGKMQNDLKNNQYSQIPQLSVSHALLIDTVVNL